MPDLRGAKIGKVEGRWLAGETIRLYQGHSGNVLSQAHHAEWDEGVRRDHRGTVETGA